VDEKDEVRFYSEGDRVFPRAPAIIGRKVQNCHPPKSVHIVQGILESFRRGEKDVAEFGIEVGGRFIHIRYFALHTSGAGAAEDGRNQGRGIRTKLSPAAPPASTTTR
jgi:DUF438 domain-containing protein